MIVVKLTLNKWIQIRIILEKKKIQYADIGVEGRVETVIHQELCNNVIAATKH